MKDYFKVLKEDENLQETIIKVNENNKVIKEFLISNKNIFDYWNLPPDFTDFGDRMRDTSIKGLSKTYSLEELFEIFIGSNYSDFKLENYKNTPFKDFLNNPEILNKLLQDHLEEFKEPGKINPNDLGSNPMGSGHNYSKKLDKDFIERYYLLIKDLELDEVNHHRFSNQVNLESMRYQYYKIFKEYLKSNNNNNNYRITGDLYNIFQNSLETYTGEISAQGNHDLSFMLLNNIEAFDKLFKFLKADEDLEKIMKFSISLKELMEQNPTPELEAEDHVVNRIYGGPNYDFNDEIIEYFIKNYNKNMPIEWNVELYFNLVPAEPLDLNH